MSDIHWAAAFFVGLLGFISSYAHWAAWHSSPDYYYGRHKSGIWAVLFGLLMLGSCAVLEGPF